MRHSWMRPVTAALCCCWAIAASQGQSATTLRAVELRGDKLPDAPVLRTLPAGTPTRILSLEGGWAMVDAGAAPGHERGWLRASSLNPAAPLLAAASLATGRDAAGNQAVTLGVRSLPARHSRHALIIGISRYADPSISSLPGAHIDRESATQMALAMEVPPSNIRYVQDEQATGDGIRRALRTLGQDVRDGDQVFIHYSGHGTRVNDTGGAGCVESLLAHDGGVSGTITNREMADLIKPISDKTDKLFVMYDACHAGGVIDASPAMRSRGIVIAGDEGRLRPKFSPTSEECGRPVNIKTRNLLVESMDRGAFAQDVIYLSSSRDNEISFDDELKGGLATQFMRDCMLRDARDTDGSGAISIDEIRACAQQKIDRRMANDSRFKAHHMVLSGNTAFVPVWHGKEQLNNERAATAAAVSGQAAPSAVPTPPPLTGAQALRQVFDQRDAKRRVAVSVPNGKLRIGKDRLAFTVQSDRPGYLYVAMAGSDNQLLYLLLPNELDRDNRIEAGKPYPVPRDSWRVQAGGPVGANELLVIVADGPRDLAALAQSRAGPFVKSLNDAAGRADLGALLTRSRTGGEPGCAGQAGRRDEATCSDAFGAATFTVEEIE
jgi:hypothetical protein